MSFSFSFEENDTVDSSCIQGCAFPTRASKRLDFREMVFGLPDRISYSIVQINEEIVLGRRELYDIKLQMISEEDEMLDACLGKDDIVQGVYEGGFKTWESANDLICYLQTITLPQRMVELGCGSGLPSCYMLTRAIKQNHGMKIILQDYNESVLLLSTIANIIVNWWTCLNGRGDGELSLTQVLKNKFLSDLESRRIELEFVAGGWKGSCNFYSGMGELLVSSESWYSADSVGALVELIGKIIKDNGVAVVAGKRHYFGVGGGTQMFLDKVKEQGLKGVLVSSIEGGIMRDIVKITDT